MQDQTDMALTNTKMIMHEEYNPVFKLKAQKMGVVDIVDNDPEATTGFKTPESLGPIVVKASQESAELTIIGKLKMIQTELVECKEESEHDEEKSQFSPWKMVEKSHACYNPEDYPALGKISRKSPAKFSLPKVVKMTTSEKDDFEKDMAKNLTSSMSSRPTLYKRAPTAREKGFAVLKGETSFKKTCMCKWGSKCRNKEKCNYAHDECELQARMCAFGNECNKKGCRFPHNEQEADKWKSEHIAKWIKSQNTRKLPGKGYVCRSCGKEGGCEDSHWVRDCPHKKKRSAPGKGYTCKCCGQKGGEEGAHWIQQCPKSKGSPQKKRNSPKKVTK